MYNGCFGNIIQLYIGLLTMPPQLGYLKVGSKIFFDKGKGEWPVPERYKRYKVYVVRGDVAQSSGRNTHMDVYP